MKRRIYLASSWKNACRVRELALLFRAEGHEVFDFTDPDNSVEGIEKFVFSAAQWSIEGGKPAAEIDWLEFLSWTPSKRAFKSDKAGLDWADTVVLLLPSGRSSHLEAGYGVGKGKDLFIFGDLCRGEFDAMYGFAAACFRGSQLLSLMEALKNNRRGENE